MAQTGVGSGHQESKSNACASMDFGPPKHMRSENEVAPIDQTLAAFFFFRPNRPSAAKPVPKSGNAGGMGVVAKLANSNASAPARTDGNGLERRVRKDQNQVMTQPRSPAAEISTG